MNTFDDLFEDHVSFTSKTFPKGTNYGAIKHLRRELEEVEEELKNHNNTYKRTLAIEFADCLGCLIDSANRSGISPHALKCAFDDKLTINKTRKWKDNGDGSYSHIKQ